MRLPLSFRLDSGGYFLNYLLVHLHIYLKGSGEDIGSSLDHFQMQGVIQIEFNCDWSSFWRGPEHHTSLLVNTVDREGLQQIDHEEVEALIEQVHSHLHTLFIGLLGVHVVELSQFAESLQ